MGTTRPRTKKTGKKMPEFIPFTRCDWCGNLSKKKEKRVRYFVDGAGHRETALVCSRTCGEAWKRKASERVAMIDKLFAPNRSRTLTRSYLPSIIKSDTGREVRNYGTQAR